MKTIKNLLIIVALIITVSTTAAQAQFGYRTNMSIGENYVSNTFSFGLGNKLCPNSDSPLTDTEIADIIRVHNETRSQVGTGALKWNCALADFAQKWANKDTGEHSSEKERQDIIQGSLAGENLAQDSESNQTVQKLMQGWIDEKAHLNSDAKTCAAGKVCGHYTQMVWKTTTEVGCGIFRQSNTMGADFKGKATYLVCIYNPSGNVDGVAAY